MTTSPFIGRREAIGFGKESSATPGTPVSATSWIPKKSGIIQPKYDVASDTSGYGTIDETFDTQTTKNTTEIAITGIVRDDFVGHLFMGALGTYTALTMTKGASITNTPLRGNACYQGANLGAATWTGILKKILIVGANTYHFFSTVTGSFGSGTSVKESATDAWTVVSADSTTYAAVKSHLFERANTNTHPTYTVYGDDPVGAVYTPYAMINKLSLKGAIGDYMNFEVDMMGKKLITTTAQSPAYTTTNPFLAKHSAVKFATAETGLNAAVAVCMQSFNININKNLIGIQCFGDTDISELHNQQFTLDGDLEALYDAIILRDYVVNSTKEACRFQMINTEATALVTGIYPSIYIDMAKLGFEDWKKSDDLNGIVKQTMGFKGQYDTTTSMSIEILLLNSTTAAY